MVSNSIINNSIVHIWQLKGFGCFVPEEWQQRSSPGCSCHPVLSLCPCLASLKIWKAAHLLTSDLGSYLTLSALQGSISPLNVAVYSAQVGMRVWRGANKRPQHLVRAIAPGCALALTVCPWLSTSWGIQTDCDTSGKPESPVTAARSGAQRIGTWCILSSELGDWWPGARVGIVGMMCVNFEPVQGKAHYSPFIPCLTYPEGTGAVCGSTAPEAVHKILPLLCQKCSWWLPAAGCSLAHRFVGCFGPQHLRCQYGLATTLCWLVPVLAADTGSTS